MISTRPPEAANGPDAPVRRIFTDYETVERDYFQRTGHFPIMHTVILRRDVYEQDPVLALVLLRLFEESKRRGLDRVYRSDVLAVMHPWVPAEKLYAFFRGDPFSYGLSPNHWSVEAVARYSWEQGLSDRLLTPQEIFAAETHDWTPDAPSFG